MISRALVVAVAALALGGCRRRVRVPPLPPAVVVLPPTPSTSLPPPPQPISDELEPGSLTAYGLVLPIGSVLHLETGSSRMYFVQAPMDRVMRYLQRRLVFHQGDIHPLGAMIRGARVADAGVELLVDVGVREEGSRTLLTVWNRTQAAPVPGNVEDGYHSAGVDPRSGQLLPQFNN